MENNHPLTTETIKSRIYLLRSLQVMLDEDLAILYNVETRRLNEQVRRNIERFPQEFMFQLTEFEYHSLRSQIAILDKRRGTHRKYLPYAFTEQSIAMLSGVLKSDTAIKVSIQIMNAFVAMRKFIASNTQLFQRLDSVEKKQIVYDQKFELVFDAIQSKDLKPEKGIFFEGQIFDAYKFISDIIRTANQSLILIDNYIDDSVLTLLSKRNKEVKVIIFTKEISYQLSLDLKKYNSQYPSLEIKEFKQSHDRFLIIDNKEVYHFGASLKCTEFSTCLGQVEKNSASTLVVAKNSGTQNELHRTERASHQSLNGSVWFIFEDLGKKWFAFSKFDKETFTILEKLGLK